MTDSLAGLMQAACMGSQQVPTGDDADNAPVVAVVDHDQAAYVSFDHMVSSIAQGMALAYHDRLASEQAPYGCRVGYLRHP